MMLRPTRSTRTDPLVPDTTVFRSFQEDLLALVAQERKTFLFVTHSIEEAVYVSDRIVLLSRRPSRVSQIVEPNIPRDGDPEDIRSEEQTSELQSLMRISYAVFCFKKKTSHLTASPN